MQIFGEPLNSGEERRMQCRHRSALRSAHRGHANRAGMLSLAIAVLRASWAFRTAIGVPIPTLEYCRTSEKDASGAFYERTSGTKSFSNAGTVPIAVKNGSFEIRNVIPSTVGARRLVYTSQYAIVHLNAFHSAGLRASSHWPNAASPLCK